jgi:hypothetical protein
MSCVVSVHVGARSAAAVSCLKLSLLECFGGEVVVGHWVSDKRPDW